MKKLTESDILGQQIRVRRSLAKSTRKHKTANGNVPRIFSRVKVTAPQHLDLFDLKNYNAFIVFISELQNHIEGNGEKVIIDFGSTTNIKACAVIVLYAYLDFWQTKTKNPQIATITTGGNSMVNKWLRECGIWDLTKVQYKKIDKSTLLPIISAIAGGTNADQEIITKTREKIKSVLIYIQDVIYGGKLDQEEKARLYAALTESISNVGLHAYSEPDSYSIILQHLGKKLWIFTRKVNEQLFTLIFDMGSGIPVTLGKKHFFSEIVKHFNPKNDSDRISAAVKYGETRMKDKKHGKGLPEIKEYVVNNPMGQLNIFSGKGSYCYDTKTNKEYLNEMPKSIGGTLIQWNVNIGKSL
ncbi:hypothetical protein MASR2M36_18270 [Providencia sp.]